MIPWLPTEPIFPPVQLALSGPDGPDGLLAVGGDLSPERIIAAYRRGIFPWYSPGDPILWWSPDPRMVLFPKEFRISRSMAKTLRNLDYEVRLDTAFAEVMTACAHTPRDGQPGTWITPEMQAAYCRLHELGRAHSVETWMQGKLVGGLYGVALGRVFYGESMFSVRRDASKIALAHLCMHLRRHDFGIIDCQMETAHLTSLGARPISRGDFVSLLDRLAGTDSTPGRWPANGVLNAFKPNAPVRHDGPRQKSD